MKNTILILILCIAASQTPSQKHESDRMHDGFLGPVKKVFVFWKPVSGSPYPSSSKCRQLTDEYDQAGRITRHSIYPGSCGADEIREVYTYTSDGTKSTKRVMISAPDSPEPPPPAVNPTNAKTETGPAKEKPKFDNAGRLIEMSKVMPSGKLSYKTTFKYDSTGRLIDTTSYDRDGQVTDRRVLTYSADERVPSEFTYYGPDGKVYDRTTYSDYEFNSKGDWIKRTETSEETFNRRSVSVVYREIEYYLDKN